MPGQLYFRNQLYGDIVTRFEPDHASQTPPAILVGLLQPSAYVDSSHKNRLWSLSFTIKIERSSDLLLLDAIAAIQEMQNERGDLLYKVSGVTKIKCVDWILMSAPQPQLLEGFGSRLLEAWVIRFVGSTRPERF